jgi:pimeloyl-ACP methyl ester carboxylesterase
MNKHHPFHPIIYVRGFAATQGEIEETCADPYMGFNLGSTKTRMAWNGQRKKFFFESPLIRLITEHKYDDVYVAGDDLIALEKSDEPVPYRALIIYRYYDEASEEFGRGETPAIQHFAAGLSDLILRLREKVCANPKNAVSPADFRVYLVAHSMGGLVCRAFLQNADLGEEQARRAVDKLFTYATPHNGIDLRIVRNVPAWASFGDLNNFNRGRMADYLKLADQEDVSVVVGFPPERIFNLVGTNPSDYLAAKGLSSWAAGDGSDGLVRIENATTHGPGPDGADVSSPRAYVHRSHSGHYGIVNSEEGYQNLTRFFFGEIRIDGVLDIDSITLPAELEQAKAKVKASYQFEVVVSVRGCQWQMHQRTVREGSAIFRTFEQLFPAADDGTHKADRKQSPHLFSVFLDPKKSMKTNSSVSFAFDLKVVVPDYEVDQVLFLKRHYEGGYIYRQLIIVEALQDAKAVSGWKINYGYQDETPGLAKIPALTEPLPDGRGITFSIPVRQDKRPGIAATLRIEARPWS